MNHLAKPSFGFLTVFCLVIALCGCGEKTASRSAPATGSTTGTAATVSPSEAQKKVQELDKAIAETRKSTQMPEVAKQQYIAAMEKAKADFQAKAK